MTRILDTIIQYGALLFVFLIPWQARLIISGGAINGRYWEYGTRSLYATEILLFAALAAVVIKGGMRAMRRWPRFSVARLMTPAGALLLLVVWAGASVFWSPDRPVAFEHWLALVSGVAVFFILASGVVPFSKLSRAVILAGSIQAVLGFVQFRLQEVTGSTWLGMAYQHASVLGASVVETDTMRMLRAYGSFPHPNILGGWLVLSLLLAIKEVKRTPLAHIAIAVMSVGLAVTFSRSAWLAFGVGLVIWLVAKRCQESFLNSPSFTKEGARGWFLKTIPDTVLPLLVIALFVGTLVISYPEPFKERVFGGGRLEAKSYEERSGGISEALQLIKQHPAIGVGIGNYGLAVHRDIDANQPSHYYQPSHNVLLLVIAELGVIGLILMVVFLLSLRGVRYADDPHASLGTGSAILSSRWGWLSAGVFLLPLMVIALFDHYLWSLYAGMMIVAVYLGIFYLKLAKS